MRTSGSPGARIRGRRGQRETEMVARCSAERCRRRGGRRGRGRFRASLLDSVHGEVDEVEAERTAASARALVAGDDGKHNGGERQQWSI